MDRQEGPKRILHVVSAMNRGGAETLLMNVYRNIDRSKVQFDFVSHRKETCDYDKEIESLGGKVYRVSSLGRSGPFIYIRNLKKIITANPYTAVHVHTDYQGGFAALAAKTVGVKKRICHSHSNQWPQGGVKGKIILKALQAVIKYAATDYGACSEEAARFLFGPKRFGTNKVEILKNGIEVSEYANANEKGSLSIRKELKIPRNVKIIGHVGSLSHIKNQTFILRVLKHMIEEGQDVVGVLVGDGQMKNFLRKQAQKLGILDHVRFLGVRADISRLMKSFDVFLFPSLYEGFGIVTLEAQCAGTPCVVSDTVPRSTDMGLGLISYVSLKKELPVWSNEIKKAFQQDRPDQQMISRSFSKYGFNIRESVPKWLALYGIS